MRPDSERVGKILSRKKGSRTLSINWVLLFRLLIRYLKMVSHIKIIDYGTASCFIKSTDYELDLRMLPASDF